jgi:hypothetical protein
LTPADIQPGRPASPSEGRKRPLGLGKGFETEQSFPLEWTCRKLLCDRPPVQGGAGKRSLRTLVGV